MKTSRIAMVAGVWAMAFVLVRSPCSATAQEPPEKGGVPTTAPAGPEVLPPPGLILRGGTRMIYRVEQPPATQPAETPAEAMIRALRARVDPEGKLDLIWEPLGEDKIEIVITRPSPEAAKARAAYEQARKALTDAAVAWADLERVLLTDPAARTRRADPDKPDSVSPLDALLARHPQQAARIRELVRLYDAWQSSPPPLGDAEALKRALQRAPDVIAFHIAVVPDELPPDEQTELNQGLAKSTDVPGREFKWVEAADRTVADRSGAVYAERGGKTYVLVHTAADKSMTQTEQADGWRIKSAHPARDQWDLPAVNFQFDEAGGRRFAALTGGNRGRPLALIIDGRVVSIATIQARIGSHGIITGTYTQEQVEDLARRLREGARPSWLSPEPLSQTTLP